MRVMVMAAAVLLAATMFGCSASAAGRCEALRGLKLVHVTILSAEVVPATAPTGPGDKGMAAYCKVIGSAKPTRDSDIRFEVAIPEGAAWNGRYLQVGNGGFAGKIPEQFMAFGLAAGFAVAGTDDGHESDKSTDASWALHHPEKVVDYGYRALRETTVAGKAITGAYGGHAPRFSYFAGCSDGGREALMEAQRFPDDFDGIVAGDPANHFTHLVVEAAADVRAMDAPGGYISQAKLPAIEAAVLHACGDQDGVIEAPLSCRFDPAVLACSGAETDQCLTPAELATLRGIYGGLVDPQTGARIFWGLDPGGEAEPHGWGEWVTGTAPGPEGDSLVYGFGVNFYKYMLYQDPNYPFPKFDLNRDLAAVDAKLAGEMDAYDPDLSAFRKHGGKLIQYHGWADPAIPARNSLDYFRRVQAKMGGTADFYRLFMAPGMLHCGGGAGPNVLPTLKAITEWVEAGQAPDALTAIKFKDNKPEEGVERTRPVCAYPAVAQWDGKGDRDHAESWRCVTPAPPSA